MKKTFLMLLALMLGASVRAATITNITGTGSALWTDTAIWAGGVVPGASDDVVFNGGGAGQVVVITNNVNAAVSSLLMRGKQIYINGNTGSFLNVSGNLTQTNGVIKTRTSVSKVVIGGDYFATGGSFQTLQNNLNVFDIAGNLTADSGFTFNFTLNNSTAFGSVRVGGTTSLGGATLTIASYAASTATNNTLILVQNTSTNALAGTFGNAVFGTTTYDFNGTIYTLRAVDYDSGGVNNDIVLTTVVPEVRKLGLFVIQ